MLSKDVIGFSLVTVGDLNKGEWDAIFFNVEAYIKDPTSPLAYFQVSLLSSPLLPSRHQGSLFFTFCLQSHFHCTQVLSCLDLLSVLQVVLYFPRL